MFHRSLKRCVQWLNTSIKRLETVRAIHKNKTYHLAKNSILGAQSFRNYIKVLKFLAVVENIHSIFKLINFVKFSGDIYFFKFGT